MRTQEGIVMLRLVERGRKTAFPGSGDNTISWNFATGVPRDQFNQPRISESLSEVYHEYVVFSEVAQERYTGGCQHYLRGVWKQRHTWRGVNSSGAPVEIVEETDASQLFWNTGSEQLFQCGVGLHGYHTIDEATILDDPVEFPSEHNGSWSASQTDGFATVTATLSVTGGSGTASITATSMPGGGVLAAYASAYLNAYAVGRASWRVVFKPIYPDGEFVTGKQALVVLGDVESTGYNASEHMDRVSLLVHERTAPIDEVFDLPIETVRSRVYRACGAVWNEHVGGDIIVHVDTAIQDPPPLGLVYDAAVWSRRTSCAVVWSRKAFGQTPSSVLDALGSSQAVTYGFAHASRWCWHRYHDAAAVTYVQRARLRVPPVKDFVVLPWKYNLGGIHDLPDDLLEAPPSSAREFWTNLGNPFDYFNAHEFRPYRWMELDVESETVQSQTFTLQWNLGVGSPFFGSKSWVAAIARGKQTLRIDLRDPDLVNGLPVEDLQQLDSKNPATAFFMPTNSVTPDYRFGGMGAVNSLRINLPAGAKLKVSKLRLVCEEATLEHWRGNTPVGGLADSADHFRVNGNGITVFDTSSAWDARRGLAEMGVQVSLETWSVGSGWLSPSYGNAAIVDKEFRRVPPGNLLTGAPLYSTHVGSDFRGYWGMSQEQPVGTAPVDVEVESLFGHRLTATAVPPLDSLLKVVWPPGADREVTTDKDGKGRLDERQMCLDFPPVNPRFFSPRHPEPREEVNHVWCFSPPRWVGVAFSPRGEGRRPSRDVNAAQRHSRATAQQGHLTTSRRDNTPSGQWGSTVHNERSQGASLRIERGGTEQRVHVLNERSKVLTLFRSRLDAETAEPVKTVASGEFPALTVLPGNRVAQYWIAGDSILGQVCDRDGSVIRGPEIVASGVLPVGVGAETSVGRSGLVGTLLTYQSDGKTQVILCRDALTAEPVLSVEAGDMPEVLALRDGRRFLYWSPEATGEVRALVLDGRGQVVRPIQTVVTGLDPYTGVSVREALGQGGARRVWMSAVREGEHIELVSSDGLTFA